MGWTVPDGTGNGYDAAFFIDEIHDNEIRQQAPIAFARLSTDHQRVVECFQVVVRTIFGFGVAGR